MIANLLERGTLRIADMNGRNEILRFMTRFQGIELGECDAILSCLKMRHQGERQGVCLMTRGQGRRQNRLASSTLASQACSASSHPQV